MSFKIWKNESRSDYGTKDDTNSVSAEAIKIGALQRIADAAEVMAKNYHKMESDLKHYKQRCEEKNSEIDFLKRSNASLRGYIKRIKKNGDL